MPERPTVLRLPPGWPETRAAILLRARGRCEACQRPAGETVVEAQDSCWYDPRAGWRDAAGLSGERRACGEPHGFDREPLTARRVELRVTPETGRALCGACEHPEPETGATA